MEDNTILILLCDECNYSKYCMKNPKYHITGKYYYGCVREVTEEEKAKFDHLWSEVRPFIPLLPKKTQTDVYNEIEDYYFYIAKETKYIKQFKELIKHKDKEPGISSKDYLGLVDNGNIDILAI